MNIGIAVSILTKLKDKCNNWATSTKNEVTSRGRIHAPKPPSSPAGPVINKKSTMELVGITVTRTDGTVEEIK